MKSLKTLIKMNKQYLDELRRILVKLENERTQFEVTIRNLDNELADEAIKAKENIDLARYFGDFAKRVKLRQTKLREEIKKVDERINVQREQISEAFSELKKYEIALQNAQEREKQEQNRKETIELGEIASQNHQRRKLESDA